MSDEQPEKALPPGFFAELPSNVMYDIVQHATAGGSFRTFTALPYTCRAVRDAVQSVLRDSDVGAEIVPDMLRAVARSTNSSEKARIVVMRTLGKWLEAGTFRHARKHTYADRLVRWGAGYYQHTDVNVLLAMGMTELVALHVTLHPAEHATRDYWSGAEPLTRRVIPAITQSPNLAELRVLSGDPPNVWAPRAGPVGTRVPMPSLTTLEVPDYEFLEVLWRARGIDSVTDLTVAYADEEGPGFVDRLSMFPALRRLRLPDGAWVGSGRSAVLRNLEVLRTGIVDDALPAPLAGLGVFAPGLTTLSVQATPFAWITLAASLGALRNLAELEIHAQAGLVPPREFDGAMGQLGAAVSRALGWGPFALRTLHMSCTDPYPRGFDLADAFGQGGTCRSLATLVAHGIGLRLAHGQGGSVTLLDVHSGHLVERVMVDVDDGDGEEEEEEEAPAARDTAAPPTTAGTPASLQWPTRPACPGAETVIRAGVRDLVVKIVSGESLALGPRVRELVVASELDRFYTVPDPTQIPGDATLSTVTGVIEPFSGLGYWHGAADRPDAPSAPARRFPGGAFRKFVEVYAPEAVRAPHLETRISFTPKTGRVEVDITCTGRPAQPVGGRDVSVGFEATCRMVEDEYHSAELYDIHSIGMRASVHFPARGPATSGVK